MTIKEYLDKGLKILDEDIAAIYAPYLNADGIDTINDIFLYEYGDKELLYTTQQELDGVVSHILLKYNKLYENIDNKLKENIDTTYTLIKELEGLTNYDYDETARTNDTINNDTTTITYNTEDKTILDAEKVVTPTITETNKKTGTETDVISDDTTDTKSGTDTTDEKSTTTDGGKTITEDTESTKPFDSDEFVETTKTNTTTTPTTTQTIEDKTTVTYGAVDTINKTVNDTTTFNTTDEKKMSGNETTTQDDTTTKTKKGTDTRTREKEEVINRSKEYTNKINQNDSEKEIDLKVKIDNMLRMIDFYKLNLYSSISKDILQLITLRTWTLTWLDL